MIHDIAWYWYFTFRCYTQAGGYTQRQWWVSATGDDEGWRWATYRNATHPSFWVATRHPDMKRFFGGKPNLEYQKVGLAL